MKKEQILGKNLAVFRGESGEVHVFDAYCPHMGANLGVGGTVLPGDCLQCPFHGWIFDGKTGRCVKIPYSNGKIPESAKVKKWISKEINGLA